MSVLGIVGLNDSQDDIQIIHICDECGRTITEKQYPMKFSKAYLDILEYYGTLRSYCFNCKPVNWIFCSYEMPVDD